MSKTRFNIRQALESEEPVLEVDKEAALSPEDKAIRDSAKQVMEAPAEGQTPESPDALAEDATDPPAEDSLDKSSPEEEGTPTDEVDVDADVKALDETKDVTAEAVDTAEAMEKLADNLHESLQYGGTTPTGFRSIELALKSHHDKLGLSYQKASYPALESFDSFSGRMRQTKAAIESIDSIVSKVWDAVKDSIVRMVDNVKAILGKLLFMFKTYESQIKALRIALGKTRIEEPKRDTYSNSSVIRSLSMGRTFDPDSSLVAVAKLLDEVSHQFKKACPSNLKTIKETFAAAVYTDKVKVLYRLKLSSNDILPMLKKKSNGESDRTVVHYSFDELPGGMMVSADLPKDGLSDSEYMESLRHCYATVSTDGPVNYDSKDVAIFTKKEIADVLDNALQVVNNYWSVWREFKKQIESNDIQMVTSMITQLESTKKLRQSYDEVNDMFGTKIDTGPGFTDVKKMVTAYMTAVDNIHFNFGIYSAKRSTQTVSSAISFSDTCIRAYM